MEGKSVLEKFFAVFPKDINCTSYVNTHPVTRMTMKKFSALFLQYEVHGMLKYA